MKEKISYKDYEYENAFDMAIASWVFDKDVMLSVNHEGLKKYKVLDIDKEDDTMFIYCYEDDSKEIIWFEDVTFASKVV